MKIKKVLVANRGEIAIRIFRACVEMGLGTVAVYTYEDRYSLHRYKADEAYQVGRDDNPLKPYLDMDEIIHVAKKSGVDAIHPGYGFLSENTHFAQKCKENGLIFIGPDPEVMAALGDKVAAKKVARAAKIPVIEDNQIPLNDEKTLLSEAERIGYPIMIKAAAGGGGRGMRVVRDQEQLVNSFREAKSEAGKAFGDDTIFLEKYVENPKHIEVQIVADRHGNIVHLFERDCSLQRRFQKVVEIAPSITLPKDVTQKLYGYAVRICSSVHYNNVGTVEFLVDQDNHIYFIEVNPRIQVEHTVTEMITGIDLIKTQIYIAAGYQLHDREIGISSQMSIMKVGYALQCRITTEDPTNDFKPDYGRIVAYRSAAGFGIRLDVGSVYTGATISPFFDSMLVKVSAHSTSLEAACRKMTRALKEFRIRGVKHNIPFLINLLAHEAFQKGQARVHFIKDHPELLEIKRALDRGTKALKYLAEVSVNGNPDVKRVISGKTFDKAIVPEFNPRDDFRPGTKQILEAKGPEGLVKWLAAQKAIQYTDTTFRDAHQSLLATRMRGKDMFQLAEAYARLHPEIFSAEVWGGATFDVCLRFLTEDPWDRLARFRKAMPNILLQMLIRGSNGVGYKAYPDNLIERFIVRAAETGMDIFRIFDSLNWLKAMEPSIRYVREQTSSLAEVCMCYTGDILDGSRSKYNLAYYLQLAKDIENAGAHILCVKDMAGLLKPYAAKELITALKETVKIPVHLHTHNTSALQEATYLQAVEAGVDVIDVAQGAMSGLTSQPNFNSIVEALRFQERELKVNQHSLENFSNYWDRIREYYYPFESGLKASSASVFTHEIPGGQYSNLKRQALELGLSEQWERILEAYKEVNELFGDLVKVTPSSKVVGDMALLMVSKGLSKQDILDQGHTLSFPESVKSFFRGELGQPYKGFPKELQKMVLKDEKPFKGRPNEHLTPIDFEQGYQDFLLEFDSSLSELDFISFLLYPKVFRDYYGRRMEYGDLSKIPTKNFFFGMQPNEETIIEISEGKTILVSFLMATEPDIDGYRSAFFKLNGQNRMVRVLDKSLNIQKHENQKADPDKAGEVGSPLQGLLSKIFVKAGQKVAKNDPLFIIEAMKMENTVVAAGDLVVVGTHLSEGSLVNAGDLIVSGELA